MKHSGSSQASCLANASSNIWHALNQRVRLSLVNWVPSIPIPRSFDLVLCADYDTQSQSPSDEDATDVDEDDVDSDVESKLIPSNVKKALAHLYDDDDDGRFNFGARSDIDPATLHPSQVDIIRIWQIYLDNVNPLLKVTHTPTLQARVIAAAADLTSASPTLQALMFGIYCVSMLTLSDDECMTLFGGMCGDLLRKYQLGCRQALLRCGLLRTDDRECLTAFYLYLVSLLGLVLRDRFTPTTYTTEGDAYSAPLFRMTASDIPQLSTKPRAEPRAISTNLGIAIRLAQQYVISTLFSLHHILISSCD